jgi:hypothetical protein
VLERDRSASEKEGAFRMRSGKHSLFGLIALLAVSTTAGAQKTVLDQQLETLMQDKVNLAERLLEANLAGKKLALELHRTEMRVQELSVSSAAVVRAGVWQRAARIPVCWENPTTTSVTERGWVQDSIAATWQRESALTFIGWNQCTPTNLGIRIRIADETPSVAKLGTLGNGVPGNMTLNFTFLNWSPDCTRMREGCVRATAVHEFGHALAFAHEQNRIDKPADCTEDPQGELPDSYVTVYDPQSIMNYCNTHWTDGLLSPLDIQAVRTLYNPIP